VTLPEAGRLGPLAHDPPRASPAQCPGRDRRGCAFRGPDRVRGARHRDGGEVCLHLFPFGRTEVFLQVRQFPRGDEPLREAIGRPEPDRKIRLPLRPEQTP